MTLQTLHPVSFDEGTILDQTPWPGIDVPDDCNYPALLEIMQPLGAEMLLKAIRQRLYLPPYKDVGWANNAADDKRSWKRAPKIETAHRLLCFETMDSSRMLRMSRAFESTWAFASVPTQTSDFEKRRVIFRGPFNILSHSSPYNAERKSIPGIPPGLPYWPENATDNERNLANCPLLINTFDGRTISADSMQVEGGVQMPAYGAALKHRLIGQSQPAISRMAITFHERLTV
jgi:methionyl-tRNA formyltransferase